MQTNHAGRGAPPYTLPMARVHPSSILDGDIDLAGDVSIGPNCVITGPVTIGAGSRIVGNVYLQGPLTMGAGNLVYPFTCIGFAAQHVKADPHKPGPGVVIGDGNTFREHVTVHRAFTDEHPTRIGDRSYFMASTHVGHDAIVGDDCMMVNDSVLGGHVQLGDRVTLAGGSGIHQHCRVGRGAMLAGIYSLTTDLPPYFMMTGTNICGAVNLVGLRRNGMPRDQIDTVRWVYKTMYRSGLSLKKAVDELKGRGDDPIVAEFIEFIESAQRAICPGSGKAMRGSA